MAVIITILVLFAITILLYEAIKPARIKKAMEVAKDIHDAKPVDPEVALKAKKLLTAELNRFYWQISYTNMTIEEARKLYKLNSAISMLRPVADHAEYRRYIEKEAIKAKIKQSNIEKYMELECKRGAQR